MTNHDFGTDLEGPILTCNHCLRWRYLAWMSAKGILLVDTLNDEVRILPLPQGSLLVPTREHILVVSTTARVAVLLNTIQEGWGWEYHEARTGDHFCIGQNPEGMGKRWAGSSGTVFTTSPPPNALLYGRELVRHLRWKRDSAGPALYSARGELQIPFGPENLYRIDVHPFNLAQVVEDPSIIDPEDGKCAFRQVGLNWVRGSNDGGYDCQRHWRRPHCWTRLGGRILFNRQVSCFLKRGGEFTEHRYWASVGMGFRMDFPMEDFRGSLWFPINRNGQVVLWKITPPTLV